MMVAERTRGLLCRVGSLAILLAASAPAFASAPASVPASASSPPPPNPTGVERPAVEPDDTARALASALLYVPRRTVEIIFLTSGTAAGLVHNEQVVPRIAEIVSPGDGEIGIFPTAFVETGRGFNVGARMIAKLGDLATSVRGGYGGPDEVVAESRLRWSRAAPLPSTLSLEGLYDRRTDLQYLGVGQMPEEDPRNRFAPGAPLREALYQERRARVIASLGVRPVDDLEVFLSVGLTRSHTEDPDDAGPAALSRVFAAGSVPGAFMDRRHVYSELALRLDSRETRGRPSPGGLIEVYAGTATGIGDESTRFIRAGGRLAGFISLVRRTNIISPKIVIDGIAPAFGVPIPFTELARQPDFRGIDTRRDRLSVVTSVDYRWSITRHVAARLFLDGATVAPEISELAFRHTRFAYGLGADLSSSSAEIGTLALALTPEGARVLLSFGVASHFGDRQHRD